MSKLATAIVIVMLGLSGAARAEEAATAPATRPARLRQDVEVDAFEKLYKDKTNVVLDVRTAGEFQKGHIPGAVNVDLNTPDFLKTMERMDKNQVYLVHCARGVRSDRACTKLETAGFTHLYNLLGGLDAWQHAGKPVEHSDPATEPAATQPTAVEFEKAPQSVPVQGLGTKGYQPSDKEMASFNRTPPESLRIGSIGDDKAAYDLAGQKGKWVSWIGIVREVHATQDGSTLLVEHKYFDGLTDLHILAVSFNGAGDFAVATQGKQAAEIQPLQLIRVYGSVERKNDGLPTVAAEYIRVFPWKTFTFLDCYGRDQSNPQWRKLCRVPLDNIYSPYPDDQYYMDRLGEPTAGTTPVRAGVTHASN